MNILGIRFLCGGYPAALRRLQSGALMVVPAAPGLVNIEREPDYYAALKGSDFAIPDSGFMVLLLRVFYSIKLEKLSGLAFLRRFLQQPELKASGALFLIEPSEREALLNQRYLSGLGIPITARDQYVAPQYSRGAITDEVLLRALERRKPRYILMNIGGGVQERLGYYLKNALPYRPGIICTGAALAFLTGAQVAIPEWADRRYLGWLWRCVSRPGRYVPRYVSAFRLAYVMFRRRRSINKTPA